MKNFIKMSISGLNKYKVAVVKLLNYITQAIFKIGCWSTLRYEIRQCFRKQITAWTSGVFSLLLRVVNVHILVIYNCKNLSYCFIFYEILRLQFLLKSALMLHFLAFHWHSRFCCHDCIAKMYTKIICNISSGRFDVRLQVMQPFLKFLYLISLIKSPKYVIWNKKSA